MQMDWIKEKHSHTKDWFYNKTWSINNHFCKKKCTIEIKWMCTWFISLNLFFPNCRHRCQRCCCFVIYVNWRNYAKNGLVFASFLALKKCVHFNHIFSYSLHANLQPSNIVSAPCMNTRNTEQTSTSNCFIAFQTHSPLCLLLLLLAIIKKFNDFFLRPFTCLLYFDWMRSLIFQIA